MHRSRLVLGSALALAFAGSAAIATRAQTKAPLRFAMSFPAARSAQPLDGRVLLFISDDRQAEPRTQTDQYRANSTRPIFGVDVDGLEARRSGHHRRPDRRLAGAERCSDMPPGDYFVQALLNRYETFHRGDGHIVKMPMDQGEGQHWAIEAGEFLQHAGEGARRSGARRRDRDLDGSGDAADCAAERRHGAGEIPARAERAPDEVLGPADVPRRHRAAAAGLGHASERALSRARAPRALPARTWRATAGARRRPTRTRPARCATARPRRISSTRTGTARSFRA